MTPPSAPRRAQPPRGPAPFAALALTAALATAFPAPAIQAWAAELNGPAHVIDGNSIAIGSSIVRLYGIDAPDEDQTCRRRGAVWRCGQDAGWALAERLERHWVLCETQGALADSEAAGDGVSAVCYLDGRRIDVNAWMVAQGWALADRTADLYVGQEQAAQHAGRGLWAGTFDPPWVWRQRNR